MTSINNSKRSALTLNLHSDNSCKRTKFSPGALGAAVLSSPDVKKFQLTTPEIENFILNHHPCILQTPTANAANPILFPKSLPDDQELYPSEFVDLSEYTSDSSRIQVELPKSSSSSNSSINNFMNLEHQYPPLSNYSMTMSPSDGNVVVKEEPQTVPSLGSTPPLSPINMESQERIKLERKRMRNRVAASKCRKRKLERIAKLEDKVKLLKGENNELGQIVIRLKEEVCSLKQRVMKHVDHGCKMIVANF